MSFKIPTTDSSFAPIDLDSDFVKEDRTPLIYAGIIVPTALSSIFVIARLWTRIRITRNWGIDDSIICTAWFLSLGLAGMSLLLPKYVAGRHAILQALGDVLITKKLTFVSRVTFQAAIAITKAGICCFYLRVFRDKRSKMWIYLMLGWIGITCILFELLYVFEICPISLVWSVEGLAITNSSLNLILTAVANILADIFLMIFVIPRVLLLQMSMRQKLPLLAVVSLGILVIAASVVRVYIVDGFLTEQDIPFNGYSVTTWSSIEVSTGLFCATAPTLRPLLRKLTPGWMASKSQTANGTTIRTGVKHTGHRLVVKGSKHDAFELENRVPKDPFSKGESQVKANSFSEANSGSDSRTVTKEFAKDSIDLFRAGEKLHMVGKWQAGRP